MYAGILHPYSFLLSDTRHYTISQEGKWRSELFVLWATGLHILVDLFVMLPDIVCKPVMGEPFRVDSESFSAFNNNKEPATACMPCLPTLP